MFAARSERERSRAYLSYSGHLRFDHMPKRSILWQKREDLVAEVKYNDRC